MLLKPGLINAVAILEAGRLSAEANIRHCIDAIVAAQRMLRAGQVAAASDKLRDARREAELALTAIQRKP